MRAERKAADHIRCAHLEMDFCAHRYYLIRNEEINFNINTFGICLAVNDKVKINHCGIERSAVSRLIALKKKLSSFVLIG